MSFAAPWTLLLLAAPLLYLLLHLRQQREQALGVGNDLIWRRALRRLEQRQSRASVLRDPLIWLLMLATALAVLGEASPTITTSASTPRKLQVLFDRSAAMLLTSTDKRPLIDAAMLREAGADAETLDNLILSLDHPARAGLAAERAIPGLSSELRERRGDQAALLIVTPRKLGQLPGGVAQLSRRPDPQSLPYEALECEREILFARVTRPDSEWELRTLDDLLIRRTRARGHELVLSLRSPEQGVASWRPASRPPLKLTPRNPASEDALASAWLLPVRAPTLISHGVANAQVEALQSALSDNADVRHPANAEREEKSGPALRLPDLHLIEQRSAPAPQIPAGALALIEPPLESLEAVSPERRQGARIAINADSPMAGWLPGEALNPANVTHALPSASDAQALITLVTNEGERLPLLARSGDGKRLVSALGVLDLARLGGEDWAPLVLLGCYHLLSGNNPLNLPSYRTQHMPQSANPLHEAQMLFPTKPQPGLYPDGVINPLAPPREGLIDEHLAPPRGWLQRAAGKWQGRPLLLLLAIGLMLGICTSQLLRLESGRSETRKR